MSKLKQEKRAKQGGVLFALALLFLITLSFASEDFILSSDKGSYYSNQDVYLIVAGPGDSSFEVDVVGPRGEVVLSKRSKTSPAGNAYIHLEGFSSLGEYDARLFYSGNVKAVSHFVVADPWATSTSTTQGVPATTTATSSSLPHASFTVTTSLVSPTTPTTTVVTKIREGGTSPTTPTNQSPPSLSTNKGKVKLTAAKEHFSAQESPDFELETGIAFQSSSPPTLQLFDSKGRNVAVESKISTSPAGYGIELSKETLRPGKYLLVVESSGSIEELWFTWGLVSVNTKKSAYLPGETAEILMVVLDSEGYLVSGADVSLRVESPTGMISTYSTQDKSVAMPDAGIYAVNHSGTWIPGNYSLSVSAAANGVSSEIESYFLVQENPSFEILRSSPLTLDPRQGPFRSTLEVKVYINASSFTLSEYLPSGFGVVDAGGANVAYEEDRVKLTWGGLSNNSQVSYSFSVPEVWPYLYALGPAEIDGLFSEPRAWMLAVDPAEDEASLILFWDGADPPENWTCLSCSPSDPFYQVFPRGSDSYGGSGGQENHTHTISLVSISEGASASARSGTTNFPAASHTHSLSSESVSTESNLPEYRDLKVIAYDFGIPDTVPAGSIAVFNTSSLPSGWALYSAQDGYFVRGENSTSTGGSNNHTHTVSYTLDATTDFYPSRVQSVLVAGDSHTHSVSDTASLEDNRPPYLGVVLAKASADTSLPAGQNGVIALFNATPPGNWEVLSSSGKPFYQRFIVGSSSYGGLGGLESHPHDNLTSLSSGSTQTLYVRTGTGSVASSAHTHDVTVSFSDDSSLPPYIDVIYALLKVKLEVDSTEYLTAETVNITGVGFPALSDVTVDITYSGASVSGYPMNVSSDASGNLEASWMVPLDSTGGVYSVFAFDAQDPGTNGSASFSVIPLGLETDKTSYIREESVVITGSGFDAATNIEVMIYDPTMDPVSGYPKNVLSNSTGGFSDSWTIPAGQDLGEYTINATDTGNEARSKETTFSIATAIVQADLASYEQGETLQISGYSWDPGVDVTVSITDPLASVVYGPVNLTSNASGWITGSWDIPYNAGIGPYSLDAFEPSNPGKSDGFLFSVVGRPVALSLSFPWYKGGDSVGVSGLGFSPSGTVTVDVRNASGVSVSGYPKNLTSNISGGVSDSWSVPSAQETGVYSFFAWDFAYPNLNSSASFDVVVQYVETDKSAYKSGESVQVSGFYWDRDSNVTLDIQNSTGGSALGYPVNVSVSATGYFSRSWTAQPGSGVGAENYNLSARQALDGSENSFTSFEVTKVATILTDKPTYLPNESVAISGSFYNPFGDVKLWLRSLGNDGLAKGYPKIVGSDASGDISDSWNTSEFCPGNYLVSSADQTYPGLLFSNITFSISYRDNSVQTCDSVWGFDCSVGPPDADNTFDSCPTGIGGDESVINIYLNATVANPGDLVEVTCEFDPYSTSSEEYIYYYNGSGWTNLYSGAAPGDQNHNRSASTVIDDSAGTHWFRCIIDWGGEADGDECADVSTYYDNDDINLTVYIPPETCELFDIEAPSVRGISVFPDPQDLGLPVLIEANLSDPSGVDSVSALVAYPGGQLNLSMSDPNSDGIYNCTFSLTSIPDAYNVSVWANDSWGNVNDSEAISFTIAYDTLSIGSAKQSYIRSETVEISGTGFSANSNITLDIRGPLNLSVATYPKNISSNSTGGISGSWQIPLDQDLGTYTLNATDASDPSRSIEGVFDIVTAVVRAEFTEYEQGETLQVSGYNWDPGVDVTVNITGPLASVVYGPVNLTSNASGWITGSWDVPYNASAGSYVLSAFEPSDPDKSDDFSFSVVGRPVFVSSDLSWYKVGDLVGVAGSGFSPSGTVTVDVRNASGVSVLGYPVNVSANASGGVSDSWSVPSAQKAGVYSFFAWDFAYPNLNSSASFDVVVQYVETDKSAYKSGESVQVSGFYWDRDSNVTLDIQNSTGGSALGYPVNVSVSATGYFSRSWTAQPGAGLEPEIYSLFARQALDASENSSANLTVTRTATVLTDQGFYYQNSLVNITGSAYTPDGPVKVWVRSLENNGTAKGYPKTVQADASGDIEHTWNTSVFSEGAYLVLTEDQTYPEQLSGNATFNISYQLSPFENFGFEENNWDSWSWGMNSYGTVGEDCQVAGYASDGQRIVSSAVGDWAKDGGSYTGGGGEQANVLDGLDSGTAGYHGMMTSDLFDPPKEADNLSFWINSFYFGADNNQCYGAADGTIFTGTANQTVNNWGEGCFFALWVSAGAEGRTDDYYIWEMHASRYGASTGCTAGGNAYCPAQNVSVDISAHTGDVLYITAECIGRDDDALVQFDGAGYVFPALQPSESFDVVAPIVSNMTPAPSSFELLDSVSITANVSDPSGVGVVKLLVSGPKYLQENITMSDSDLDGVYNCTFTNTSLIGIYNITVWANDSWGNIREEASYFFVNDSIAPNWSNNQTYPTSPATYSPTQTYRFNVSWTDNYELRDVVIEHNFSGMLENHTVTSHEGDAYYYDYGPLAVGVYSWRMYANDSSGNLNRTDPQWIYVVGKDSSDLGLSLNGFEDNISVEIYSLVGIVANLTKPAGGYIELYINGSLINSGPSPLQNDTEFTSVGSYNVTAYYPGSQNYTSAEKTFFVTVEDTGKPYVRDISPQPGDLYDALATVVLSANISDLEGVDSAWVNVSWIYGSEVVPLSDPDLDGVFEGNFSSTPEPGRYNASFYANDSSGNLNDSEGTYFFVLEAPYVVFDKHSYIREETVQISAGGFNLGVDVTLDLRNSSGQSVSGYPKNITSNSTGEVTDSWPIPPEQPLGAYFLNASEASGQRSAESEFDVVTAVVQAEAGSYQQGETVQILGYNWDPGVEVTLNITDPAAQLIYGPVNLTSNASGGLNTSWQIPYDADLGSYVLNALEPSNPDKNDDFKFTVSKRQVSMQLDYSWYKEEDVMYVSAAGFPPDSNVSLDVYNSLLQSVAGYPKTLLSNSSGGVSDSWSIPSTQGLDNYTVNASCVSYENLWNSSGFEVVEQNVVTDKATYSSGETVHITGSYWDRVSNVTLNIKNSTGDSAAGYPFNLSVSEDGAFSASWTAQPGSSLGVEEYNLSVSQVLDSSEHAYVGFDVASASTVRLDRDEYDQNELVNVTGSFYTPASDVEVSIRNLDNGNYLPFYPQVIASDASGDITYLWNTSTWMEGSYAVYAVDQVYPDHLHANHTFQIIFLENDSSLEFSDAGDVILETGPAYTTGGSYLDTSENDLSLFYVGNDDPDQETDVYLELDFNLSALGISSPDRIYYLSVYLDYCYSGGKIACDGEDPPDEASYAVQDFEVYNFSSGSWVDMGDIPVGSDSFEHVVSWNISSGFSDLVGSSDLVRLRFESHATSYIDQYSDSYLLIEYCALNVSYLAHVEREYTQVLTNKLNLTAYDGSYLPADSEISVINSTGGVVGLASGEYFKYLSWGEYDVEVTTDTASGPLTAVIHDLNLSSPEDVRMQVAESYSGEMPPTENVTAIYALDDSALDFSHVSLYIPKAGLNITSIVHCTSWDYPSASCSAWEVNASADYGMEENDTHIWFNVSSFDAFGGGKGNSLPNLTAIRVYDVTGLGNTHVGGTLIGSGLNSTFDFYQRETKTYRAEFDVTNEENTKWVIDSTDLVYHEGLNSSWQVASSDIWYVENAITHTGGTWSSGKVTWNTSLGGQLTKDKVATFYYVFNLTSSVDDIYPVYFLCNETAMNSGSFDYSTYDVTRVGYLEVNLTTPPQIPGQGDAESNGGFKVGKDRLFLVNASISCRDGFCGEVNGTLRYNLSAQPDTAVSTNPAATPFYVTSGGNPRACSGNLSSGDSCVLSWTVNASGDLASLWEIDVLFNSSVAEGNDTQDATIEITRVLILHLSWSETSFGVCDPVTSANPAALNAVSGYNVSLDGNSNDADGLYIRGTDLSPEEISGYGDVSYLIGVSNISWNPVENIYSGADTRRLNSTYSLVASPMLSNSSKSLYYWIDLPQGQYAQGYSGFMYFMVNSSEEI